MKREKQCLKKQREEVEAIIEFEKWYENVVSDMGHLYYGVKYYQRGYGDTYSNYIKLSSTRSIKDFLDRYYGNIDYYDFADPLDLPEDQRTIENVAAILDSYLIKE